MKTIHRITCLLVLVITATLLFSPGFTKTTQADEMGTDIAAALEKLYAKSETAKVMGEKAKGILVFPEIVKGGYIIGGQYGKGGLLVDGKLNGNYKTIQVSYGLQAGLQEYGYALFFMTDSARGYIERSNGFELGVGPTIVVHETGASTSLTTTTAKAEIYAFFFDQKGLMGGVGIQGTKITKID